jgi:hypothetical protein
MTRAQLVLDPFRLLAADDSGFSVMGPEDYVFACQKIHQAIHNDESLTVRVYDAVVAEWLKEWAGRYGEQVVLVRTYSAYAALKERWGIQIPVISDSDIIRSGLLGKKLTPPEGQTFENVVLEYCYHPFFTHAVFPERQFANFLNQAGKINWTQNANGAIVSRIFAERIDQWINNESNDERRIIISRLVGDLHDLHHSLAAFKLVKNYPEAVGEKVLGDQYFRFRHAQLDLDSLSLDGLDIDGASTQIEYYLTNVREKVVSIEEFFTLLDQLSGYIFEEFSFVERFLQQHADWVTSDVIRRVERKFTPIRSGITSRLAQLRRLVAVPRPSAPDSNWDGEKWLDWIANSYMPYHRWLEVQRKYDDDFAAYANAFADWYYQNFIDLKNASPEAFTFSALYNDRHTFIEEKHTVLVVILDNFNYGFFPELRRSFNHSGINLVSQRPAFSLIPTATEVGKASIVAVTGDLTDLRSRDYPTLVAGTWDSILKQHGKSASYLPEIGALQNLSKLEHNLYFLNYLIIDKILHDSSQSYGQDHESRIHDALRVLVGAISEFARRFKIEKQLVIYVVSDHGSTRIAKDVVNVLDKKYFKGITDLQHHRYISVSDEQLAKVPQVVEAQCYIIDRKKYKTFANYLAARQYYRFAETDQDFYVHGGLTPEEVVVPFARFEFTAVQIQSPTLHLSKSDFRYAVKSRLEFEIGNPNSLPLENIYIKLRGIDTEEVYIESIAPKSAKMVSFETIFKREPGTGNQREVVVHIHYESQERSFEPAEMSFTIHLKALMESQQDDFNF